MVMNNPPEDSDSSLRIDNSFIAEWHPKYDEIESDELDYQYLVVQVKKELDKNGTLSKEIFTEILNWKSPRVKGIVKLNEFETYENVIRDVFIAEADNKLTILCRLYGIGAPVGSTILHFMHPSDFPIIDIRTAQSLHHNGYLNSPKTDLSRFAAFRTALLKIANECPSFSLREIDRALFAYHKIKLSPGNLKSSPKESKVVSDKVASPSMTTSPNLLLEGYSASLTNEQVRQLFGEKYIEDTSQKWIFMNHAKMYKLWANYIAALLLDKEAIARGETERWFEAKDIKTKLKDLMPHHYDRTGMIETGLLTSDVEVHSKHNQGFPCLEKQAGTRPYIYRFVGFNV